MKKTITADQIKEWFTLGNQFANIRITDEATKKKLDEPSPPNKDRWVDDAIMFSFALKFRAISLESKRIVTVKQAYRMFKRIQLEPRVTFMYA